MNITNQKLLLTKENLLEEIATLKNQLKYEGDRMQAEKSTNKTVRNLTIFTILFNLKI